MSEFFASLRNKLFLFVALGMAFFMRKKKDEKDEGAQK